MLQDDNGTTLTTADELIKLCHSYFSEIFSSHHAHNPNTLPSLLPRVLHEEYNGDFISTLSFNEIPVAVFAIDNAKALGPNGINGKIFREF